MMKKILIAPYACRLSDKGNPKDYPFTQELIQLLEAHNYQVTVLINEGEPVVGSDRTIILKDPTPEELTDAIKQHDTWVSVDTYFQHFAWKRELYGIVLWGMSDSTIFGHPENINLYRSRKYLRDNQYGVWTNEPFNPDAFVSPDHVLKVIERFA